MCRVHKACEAEVLTTAGILIRPPVKKSCAPVFTLQPRSGNVTFNSKLWAPLFPPENK